MKRLEGTYPQPLIARFNEKLGLLALVDEKKPRLQVFDTKAKRVVFETEVHVVVDLEWHNNMLGAVILSNTGRARMFLWDGKTRQSLPLPPLRLPQIVYDLNASPTQSVVVIQNYKRQPSSNNPSYEVELIAWDYLQNRVLWRYPSSEYLGRLQWSPDGQWLAGIRLHNGSTLNLQIFDKSGQPQSQRHISSYKFLWSPDSRHIAAIINKENEPARIEILDIGE